MNDLSIWDDYYENGKITEILFGQIIGIYGEVTPANMKEDIFDHWDIKLTIQDAECPLIKIYKDKKFLTFHLLTLA